MTEEKKVPELRFKGFTGDWEQRQLIGIINRISKNSNSNKLPKVEFEDISAGDGHLNKDVSSKFDNRKGIEFEPNDILYGKLRPYLKNWLMPNFKGIALGDFWVFRAKESDSSFIYYLIQTDKYQRVANDTSGTKMPRSDWKKVSSTNFEIPKNIAEQEKISQYLRNFDDTITLHEKKRDVLNNLKKEFLKVLFPNGNELKPKLRFENFSYNWKQRKLSEIATMSARIGWQNLRTTEFLESGDYMLITGTDFKDGAINYSTVHYVEKDRYEQDKKIQIQNGSILITKDGTLGKVALVQNLTMPATLNAGVFNVRVIDELDVDEKYLFHYLKAPFLLNYVTMTATGGTIKHLNQNILVNFPVNLPKVDEQRKIRGFLGELDNIITINEEKIRNLKKIKKIYLSKIFVN